MSALTHISLTPGEHFRVCGSLPDAVIEMLIDSHEAMENRAEVDSDTADHIREASHPFDYEDFLDKAIKDLRDLAKKVRGNNREEAERIAGVLEDLATEVFNNMDHSTHQINQALEAFGVKEVDRPVRQAKKKA